MLSASKKYCLAHHSQLVADASPLLKFQFSPFDWGVSCITLNGAIAACEASIADIETKLQELSK